MCGSVVRLKYDDLVPHLHFWHVENFSFFASVEQLINDFEPLSS